MPDWKSCEGELVARKHALEKYAGGDEESAVFFTRFDSAPAAIWVRRADAEQAAALARHWNQVRVFRHPHLLETYAAGVTVLAGGVVAYLVTEYAEENLGEILQDRPLTPDEAREMLLQVSGALAYLHDRGMKHGDLKPSNVLAIGDTIKLSSESIVPGDPAPDIRALGITLIQALTRRAETLAPDGRDAAVDLPPPFGEIARGCLNPDPALRWSANRIVASLRPAHHTGPPVPTAPTPASKPARARRGLRRLIGPAAVAAAGLAVFVGVVLRRTDAPSTVAGVRPPAPAAVAPGPAPAPPAAEPKTVAPVPPKQEAQSTRDRLATEDGITRRVAPDVPEKARNTITGKPTVVVRVTVDPAGKVTEAVMERSFSPYFTKLALEAARRWQFVSEERASPREWILQFVFTQTDTQVVARRAE